MHWQFGGNLEPVLMICELDWRECPKAIGNYVWSEIVTDVLDCLRNESTLWRVLAAIVVCVLLLRIIISKAKGYKEIATDREVLDRIGYKVDDLELKVNILTYKLQYGCWPLPHQVRKPNFRKNVRNLRLTLSNPNDRNNWIKTVLLSPGRDESCMPYPKYQPSSEYRLTELFDARRRESTCPYLRRERENFETERSSKSSKSSSGKSLKLNPIFKKANDPKRNEHFEAVSSYRNAVSVPFFCGKNPRWGRRSRRCFRCVENEKMTVACNRFTRTMDDCKRYLKQLHDSNKNLGLVRSSSETSDQSSLRRFWSETQHSKTVQERYQDDESKKKEKEDVETKDIRSKMTSVKQENSEQCLQLSNAIYPVLKMIDKRLLPSNVAFDNEIFQRPSSTSNRSVQGPYLERKKFVETSREALYQVKRKLESLHNVLRMYEFEHDGTKVEAKEKCKTRNVCENGMEFPVRFVADVNGWINGRRSTVKFNNLGNVEQRNSNSSEQYESDETCASSVLSIQNYYNASSMIRVKSIEEFDRPGQTEFRANNSNRNELESIRNDRAVYSSSIEYEKVPERIFYVLTSESSEEKNRQMEDSLLSNLYVENNGQTKTATSGVVDRYPVPMDTDEDVPITPRSSRTEFSKDSELDDKPTAVLLQEALQFKKALLTRVELEKIYYVGDRTETIQKDSYLDGNIQSKILDIISEEQSVSSSTEKSNRTYVYFNVKQSNKCEDDLPNFPKQTQQTSDAGNLNLLCDSKQNLTSQSEYFSLSNIDEEQNNLENSLWNSRQNRIVGNESMEAIPSKLQLRYLNDTLDKSEENLIFSSCLNVTNSTVNESESFTLSQKQGFQEHFIRMNSINEFICRSINSVELFTQNFEEYNLEDAGKSKEDSSSFVDPEFLDLYAITESSTRNVEGVFPLREYSSDENKYTEEKEISTDSSSLTLKRNPAACSLLAQSRTQKSLEEVEGSNETENEMVPCRFSPCLSKEASIEMNFMQDSMTSSVNVSNESNILEQSSVTMFMDKSLDGEQLDLNWTSFSNEFSDECPEQQRQETFSADTIILEKCNMSKGDTCKKKISSTDFENSESFKNLKNEKSIDKLDFSKSQINLVSPRSSTYFTDEASSSIAKLNNANSIDMESYYRSQKDANKEDILNRMNNENLSTLDPLESNESNVETMDTISEKNVAKEFHRILSLQEFNEKNEHENSITDMSPKSGTDCFKNINDILNGNVNEVNDNLCLLKNDETDRIQSSLLKNKAERLNMEQRIIWSSISPRQYSPRDIKDNSTTKKAVMANTKSRSQENSSSKTEKIIKNPQTKGLRADSLNKQNETRQTSSKVRNLSAEPRRSKEVDMKPNRKRSKSQIIVHSRDAAKFADSQSEIKMNLSSGNNLKSAETKTKLRGQAKPLPLITRTSSKSCIPILKSRLEAARKSENESRPKSPMRGPLTVTMFCRDDVCEKNENMEQNTQVEGDSKNEKLSSNEVNGSGKNLNNTLNDSRVFQSLTIPVDGDVTPQEQVVIYVNIFTKYDHNATKIVDPNKFLEYIKNRNVGSFGENHSGSCETQGQNNRTEDNVVRNIVTVVSSVLNGNELGQSTSTNFSHVRKENEPLANILANGRLKNLCFLSVEQREIDVTAKPSVADTSTSISDLENLTKRFNNVFDKFQICGTPTELNNEEYVALLEILHQESNFVHLQELQNVCTKLVAEYQKSK